MELEVRLEYLRKMKEIARHIRGPPGKRGSGQGERKEANKWIKKGRESRRTKIYGGKLMERQWIFI